MRSTTLLNVGASAIEREIGSKYDVVKAVSEKLVEIEVVAGINVEELLTELQDAQDFGGISVVTGEVAGWDPVTKVITVPTVKGDKGDKGNTGDVGAVGPQGPIGPRGLTGPAGRDGVDGANGVNGVDGIDGVDGVDGRDLTIEQITYDGSSGKFTWHFSDGTTYVTPDLRGEKGATGSKGDKGDQGIGVHHLKGTSTTNANGDFGISPFRDTYTLYADADETINLGHFTVANGVSDGMSMEVYDANANGVVDNSERLGNELPTHYVNVVTNQGIGGTKTFLDDVVVQGSVTVDTLSYNGFGTTSWNADESTLDVVLEGATLQVGQETLVKVRAGTSISNGKVVMATGSIGNSGRIIAGLHDGTVANGKRILGVSTHDIANGADGLVTSYGKVRNINTTGSSVGETWVDGDILYVKPNDNGSLTKITPTDTQLNMPVALVIHAHTNGTLFVRVSGIDENKVATSSKKLETARSISLTGDVTGTVNFDGSANASITTTIAANSVALGTDTTGNYVAGVTQGAGITVSGTAGEGWSPTISITNVGTAGTYTKVTTNAQGQVTAGATLSASDIPVLDASKITSGTLSLNTTGSAATLTTSRTIGMTGDVTWTSGSFNGSANVTGAATLANSGVTAGTYDNVTVDIKGRVTSATNNDSANISALDI